LPPNAIGETVSEEDPNCRFSITTNLPRVHICVNV
jgi:hypothetical protein